MTDESFCHIYITASTFKKDLIRLFSGNWADSFLTQHSTVSSHCWGMEYFNTIFFTEPLRAQWAYIRKRFQLLQPKAMCCFVFQVISLPGSWKSSSTVSQSAPNIQGTDLWRRCTTKTRFQRCNYCRDWENINPGPMMEQMKYSS